MENELTLEKVSEVVVDKMAAEKQTLVTKEAFTKASEKSKADYDALKTKNDELTEKNTELTKSVETLNEGISKLDKELVKMKAAKSVEKAKNQTLEELAMAITRKVFNDENPDGAIGKIEIKSAADLMTEGDVAAANNDGTAVTGIDQPLRTLWTQIVQGVSRTRRLEAEYINEFNSITLNGVYIGGFAITDNATLPVKIGECELKPSVRFDIDFQTNKHCKVAEHICFSDEYEFTVGNFYDQILNVLRSRIARAVPREFIKDIIAQSSDFQNTLAVTLPAGDNIKDAIDQVILEGKLAFGCKYDQVHMTSSVMRDLKKLKDNQGRPLYSCGCMDGMLFGEGVKVVENDDLPDSDGILFIDSMSVTKADMNSITMEDISDKADRLRNKKTILMETKFGSFIHPVDAQCVKYDTLTDIKAQLGL